MRGIAPSLSVVATLGAASLALACQPKERHAKLEEVTITSPGVIEQRTLAEVGLEAASLDRTANPCEDFYQFACGGWSASHEIPAERSRWSRFDELDELNEKYLHAILEEAASKPSDEATKKLGDFYASCMDEAAVERAGLKALEPTLAQAKALAKVGPKSLGAAATAMIATLHAAGTSAVFVAYPEADNRDATKTLLTLDSGGLGLPDRDYYLEASFADKRTAYQAHLQRVFALLGEKPGQAKMSAANVVYLETELAKLTKSNVERRDVPAMFNPDLDLAALAPNLAWNDYGAAVGLTLPTLPTNVTSPKYFAGVSRLLSSIKPNVWASYFTYRAVRGMSSSLPKAFVDEFFSLSQALSGVKVQRERYKRCIDATSEALPELLGQPYVAKHFPGDSKTQAKAMIDAIAAEMAARIEALPWMEAATKAAAKSKLAKLGAMVGYPDTWRTYDFAVDRGEFTRNVLVAQATEVKRQFAKVGKPYDPNEWLMPAYLVNAYYNPNANNTGLPAGILQPPFFGAQRSVAANLGGIGMVIGHELTHGFDDQGAQFDERGNQKNWWSPADLAKFTERGQCVAAQYATFEALPGKPINGELTLGENIADLGGVKMAFHAYRALRRDAKTRTEAEGLSEDQQFFVAVGQAWCSKYREEEALLRLTTDVHAPPRFRVLGALRNLPEFATAFQCPAGSFMNPKVRCEVW